MKKQRIDGEETRNKLLVAAAEVFAKKGFWETTNADICGRAGTNIAAVNYHFRSKENLYIEAWKYSFEKATTKYPPDGGISPEAPIQKRLHGRVLSFMQRVADPEMHDIEIMHKEMANPTGLFTEDIINTIEPIQSVFESVFKDLLGDSVSEQQIHFCHMSVISQCFGPMLHLRHIRTESESPLVSAKKSFIPAKLPIQFNIEELASHITQFSLVGIMGIRKENKKTTKKSHKSR
jgi:AcrR family transcriptional regulator